MVAREGGLYEGVCCCIDRSFVVSLVNCFVVLGSFREVLRNFVFLVICGRYGEEIFFLVFFYFRFFDG